MYDGLMAGFFGGFFWLFFKQPKTQIFDFYVWGLMAVFFFFLGGGLMESLPKRGGLYSSTSLAKISPWKFILFLYVFLQILTKKSQTYDEILSCCVKPGENDI